MTCSRPVKKLFFSCGTFHGPSGSVPSERERAFKGGLEVSFREAPEVAGEEPAAPGAASCDGFNKGL